MYYCFILWKAGHYALFTRHFYRGPANEWYEAVSVLVRQGVSLRRWFVIEVLLAQPDRIIEYLMECPVGEVSPSLNLFNEKYR